MEIRKTLIVGPNVKDTWYNLIKTHLPEYEDESRLLFEEPLLTFSLLAEMDAQILNGGVMQFLDNGSGAYFHETIDALNRIGYTEVASVLEKIKSHFPNQTVPKDMEERRDIIDMLNETYPTLSLKHFRKMLLGIKEWNLSWTEIDAQYYDNRTRFYQLAIDYLKANATLID